MEEVSATTGHKIKIRNWIGRRIDALLADL